MKVKLLCKTPYGEKGETVEMTKNKAEWYGSDCVEIITKVVKKVEPKKVEVKEVKNTSNKAILSNKNTK